MNDIEKVTEAEAAILDQGKCPDCASEKFYLGPRGGLSQNVMCCNCKSEFNLTAGIAGTFGKQRLSKPDNGGRV